MSYNFDALLSQLNTRETDLDNAFYLIEQQYYREKQKYFEKRSEIQKLKITISEQKRREKNGNNLFFTENLQIFPTLNKLEEDDIQPKFYAKNFLKTGIEIEEIDNSENVKQTESVKQTMIDFLKSSKKCNYCHAISHNKDECPKLLLKKCYVCGEQGHDLYHCKTKNQNFDKNNLENIKTDALIDNTQNAKSLDIKYGVAKIAKAYRIKEH